MGRKAEQKDKQAAVEKGERQVQGKGQNGAETASGKISLETPIDNFVELVKSHKKMDFKSLAGMLGWSVESVERVGLVLEKQGILDVHYPTMVTSKPNISFVKALPPENIFENREELDKYLDYIQKKRTKT